MDKISIIIPSYNQGKYLGRTLDSILSQNDPNLEIIVMDGGSTDNTLEVLEAYRDKIAILVSEKDKGQSDALNNGYKKATGEFIGWQNSDDIYLPGSFQKFRETLKRATDAGCPADVYYGNQLVIDSKDRPLYGKIFGSFDKNYLFYVGWNITNQCSFFKKSKIEEIGGFDSSLQFAMDFDFYVRLGLGGARFHWIDSYLGGFRIHELSKGSTMQNVRSKEYVTLRKKYIPGYNENLDWNKQFRLIRLSLYLKRLAFLLMNKNFMQGIIAKFFPNHIRIVVE